MNLPNVNTNLIGLILYAIQLLKKYAIVLCLNKRLRINPIKPINDNSMPNYR